MKKIIFLVAAAAVIVLMLAYTSGGRLYRKITAARAGAETNAQRMMAGVTPDNSARVEKFWARAQKEYYKSPEELKAQNARELRKGEFYATLLRGNPRIKAVALTFDDGPHPEYTPKLLAILKKYKVRATFFVIGKMVEQYPDMVRAEDADGNLVANHTYHHVNLNRVPLDEIALEWKACNAAVKSVIRKDMKYCRPPGGDYDSDVITAAADAGLITVLWTDDPGDYASPGEKLIDQRVLNRVSDGGIILLHDGVQQTVDVLPQIIESLQDRGFKFQTADEMYEGLHSPRGY